MLGCFEVQQGLVEVCSVFGGVGDSELVALHLASLVRLQVGVRSLLNGSSDRCSGDEPREAAGTSFCPFCVLAATSPLQSTRQGVTIRGSEHSAQAHMNGQSPPHSGSAL